MIKTIYLSDYKVPVWKVESIDITLQIFAGFTKVTSILKIAQLETSAPLCLNGEALQDVVISIKADNGKLTACDYQLDNDVYRVNNLPSKCTLVITNTIVPEENTTLSGLYRSNNLYCTQCEAEGFRRIMPYLDRPDVLSVFTCRIEADIQFPVLLSNGNLIDEGKLENERHFVTWFDPHPKPAYLFAAVAGQLASISSDFTTASGNKVLLEIYAEQHYHENLNFAMDVLKSSMRWDEEYFGREYDLDRFMIVATEDFNFGAMENKGLNIFNVSALIASPQTSTDRQYENIRGIIAHEYFHNWSGNRVTLRDWFQLSLKEGFTVFRDAYYSRTVGDAVTARIGEVQMLKQHQFSEDASRLSHPARPSSYASIDNFYTSTVYEKGAEIVGMYLQILGKQQFRAACDYYFDNNDGKAACIEDFFDAMQKHTSEDLSDFFHWYNLAGTPKVKVKTQWNPNDNTYQMDFEQSLESGSSNKTEHPAFLIPIKYGLIDAQTGEEVPVNQSDDGLILLREKRQSVKLSDIDRPVVPSLLRGFSAPVNLDLDIDEDSIAVLARNDTDPLVRYESIQKMMRDTIIHIAKSPENVRISNAFDDAICTIFEDKNLSGMAIKMFLLCPNDAALQMKPMAILECHTARGILQNHIAQLLRERAIVTFETCTELMRGKAYVPMGEDANIRALRGLSLSIGIRNGMMQEQAFEMYMKADNLTDRLSAIHALQTGKENNISGCNALLAQCLQHFESTFSHLTQAMDVWMAIQASSNLDDVIGEIETLYSHSHFSWKTPNRVRALIASFAAQSITFHSFAGYSLLSSAIGKVDAINPSASSRLFGFFSNLQSWPENLQKHARESIAKHIDSSKTSKQLSEQMHRILT